MCRLIEQYSVSSSQETINDAHLEALKMVLLKILRSTWNPSVLDNYADARNYITIAADCAKEKDTY